MKSERDMITRFFRRWAPTVLVTAAVLWLTLAPHPVPETRFELFDGADKVVHAVMMGGLAAALLFDIRRRGGWKLRPLSAGRTVAALLCVAAFAALDEWAQGAMALGRTSDPADLLADWAGILLAGLASLLYPRTK